MIPVKLSVRNFLSYGEDVEPLDFNSFQMACLSGRNGHGKSALLDAMTWAIWGEARKAGYSRTPDADLLRQSADSMAVEFTFQLDGQEYQVYRDYTLKRKSGKLEFRMRKGPGEPTIVLTGSSKRETQKRIVDTIGLDYNTFRNSSFLQQGKADAFTRQNSRDRKDLLCNILGLEYYERLLEETKLRLSTARAERKALQLALEGIEKELEQEEEIKKQEQELNDRLKEHDTALAALREQDRQLAERIAQLNIIRERVSRWQEDRKQISQLLADSTTRQSKLQQEQASLQSLMDRRLEIEANHERLEEVNRQLNRLIEVENEFRQLDAQRQENQKVAERKRNVLREKLAALGSERQGVEKSIQESDTLIAQREEIEKDHLIYRETHNQLLDLHTHKPEYEKLITEKSAAESLLDAERQRLNQSIAELRGSVSCLPSLSKEVKTMQEKAAALPTLEEETATLRVQMEKIVETGQENLQSLEKAKSELNLSKREETLTRDKLALIEQSDSPDCPLCKQSLRHGSREEIHTHFQEELDRLQKQQKSLNTSIKECEKKRKDLRTQYDSIKEKMTTKEAELQNARQTQANLETRQAELTKVLKLREEMVKQMERLEKAEFAQLTRLKLAEVSAALERNPFTPEREMQLQKHLQTQQKALSLWEKLLDALQRREQAERRHLQLRQEIESIEASLKGQDFAKDEITALNDLLKSMKPLQEQLETRKPLQDEQNRLRNALVDWNRLQQALTRLPEIGQELQTLSVQHEQNGRRLQEIEAELKRAEPELQQLQQTEAQRKQKEAELKQAEAVRGTVQMQLGGVRQKIAHIEKQKAEQKQNRERLAALGRDEHVYDVLRDAFSRDGIPAMIVDQSLPELEADANRLLQRLSEGRCSITLESQRLNKSGGMCETLDIKISDEMGTRDYEMFSGGEAFRTDLALRIALSQLLCRRAGRRLQMLVIDEGFGTQDSEGLNNIVEAIDEIQDEFEKIIVVTHLEELKEKFLTRIEVTKEPGLGSRYQIIHTG